MAETEPISLENAQDRQAVEKLLPEPEKKLSEQRSKTRKTEKTIDRQDDEIQLPDSAKQHVIAIGKRVTNEQINKYERIQGIEDRSHKFRTVLQAWENQQEEERKLRKTYANWFLAGLFLQVVLINTAFFFIGFGLLVVEKWLATTFIMAVFIEITALVSVIVNYLFPKGGKSAEDFIKLIEKL
jgi:cation transport ATPase